MDLVNCIQAQPLCTAKGKNEKEKKTEAVKTNVKGKKEIIKAKRRAKQRKLIFGVCL